MDQKNTNLNKTIYTKFTLNPKSNVQKQTTNKILEDPSLSMNKHLKINNSNKNNNKIFLTKNYFIQILFNLIQKIFGKKIFFKNKKI